MAAPKQDNSRDDAKEIQRVTIAFKYTKTLKRKGTDIKIDDIRCYTRLSTAKKLGIEPSGSIRKEGNRIIRERGAKGAKSYRLLYKDSNAKSGYNSYSLPVPGWVNLLDFCNGILKNIADGNRPDYVVSPHGIFYSKETLKEVLEDNLKDTE